MDFKIELVPLAVEDVDRSVEFYGELLGLEELGKPPALAARGGVWFRVGDQQLHVGVDDAFSPATKAHPAFRVSSPEALDRLAERLEREGVPMTRPAPDEIPGAARVFTVDPWGNRVELVAFANELFI